MGRRLIRWFSVGRPYAEREEGTRVERKGSGDEEVVYEREQGADDGWLVFETYKQLIGNGPNHVASLSSIDVDIAKVVVGANNSTIVLLKLCLESLI